ncbi:g11411 [Coccomyxa elongata]
MVKKAKGKHRLDKFYHLAKEQGFRSRAAFKLIQLNRQYHFLDRCRSVLDLCAAPGGWLQVAQKALPVSSLIIGIDLAPIRAIRGVHTIVGDITTQKARQAIKKETGGESIECVLHDGAPNVGGAWSSEAYSQSALVLEALRLATDVLAPKGNFVTKIFRSKDYNALLYAFKQLFDKVDATKPAASRNTSAEIFVVCQGYKAPGKIDPRLLDPKHLFKEVAEEPKKLGPDALLRQKVKQKRFREGYEDGLSTMHKATTAAAFIASEEPVEMLGNYSRFELEGSNSEAPVEGVEDPVAMAVFVRFHPSTTAEIRALCNDLQVLGRSEFKQLLKWRLAMKKALALSRESQGKDGGGADEAEEEAEPELDEEERILGEMDEVRSAAAARAKKERKKRREAKTKARVRAAQLALSEGIANEDNGPDAMFSLAAVKGARSAQRLAEAPVPDEAEAAAESPSESDSDEDVSDTDEDSDDARMRYDAETEEALEEAYQGYLQRKGKREELEAAKAEAAQRVKRARLGKGGELDGVDEQGSEDEEDEAEPPRRSKKARAAPMFTTVPAAEDAEEEEEGGGLLVRLDEGRSGKPTSAAVAAARWFAQDMFDDPNLVAEEENTTTDLPASRPSAPAEAGPRDADEDEDEEEQAGNSSGRVAGRSGADPEGGRSAPDQACAVLTQQPDRPARSQAAAGFEEVPMEADRDSDDDSDDSDADSDCGLAAMDDNSRAEVLALARKMRSGRAKNDILDSAYHRYAFHEDSVPRWLYEDEKRHLRPPAVLTKEEVEAEKASMRAIDARPIKKVAEARQRKRKRLQTRLTAARAKAEAVVGQEDLSERGKAREIEKLYAKARAGKGAKKGKPSRSAQRANQTKGKPLDGRLRADKRQVNSKRKAKTAKKGRKGKSAGKSAAKWR